jgi:hypothetical protein
LQCLLVESPASQREARQGVTRIKTGEMVTIVPIRKRLLHRPPSVVEGACGTGNARTSLAGVVRTTGRDAAVLRDADTERGIPPKESDMGIPVVPKDDEAAAVAPGALERPLERGEQPGRSGPGI